MRLWRREKLKTYKWHWAIDKDDSFMNSNKKVWKLETAIQLYRSEVFLKANWDRFKQVPEIDVNEREHFLKANWDRIDIAIQFGLILERELRNNVWKLRHVALHDTNVISFSSW